jgi:hypothetical protein
MNNLAVTLENRWRLKEAEDLETQVVKINKRLLGVDHPDTLTSVANLAGNMECRIVGRRRKNYMYR